MEDVTQLVSRILFHGLRIEESMIDVQFLTELHQYVSQG